MAPGSILKVVVPTGVAQESVDDPYLPLVRQSRPLREDVRRALRSELLKGPCTAAQIARLFGLHPRTFSRYLAAEGAAYQKLVDDIRFEIARDLLANTRMALSQIASVLRFSDPSAFTRAFQRWSGQTPSVWRATHVRNRRLIVRGMLRHGHGTKGKRDRSP